MDEMTEKQEEATRIIEAIGTTTLNECYVPVSSSVIADKEDKRDWYQFYIDTFAGCSDW